METENCSASTGNGSSQGRKPSMESLGRTSRHFVQSGDHNTIETEDGDSGVFNSSKTPGSTSDADLTDDGGDGRVGVLDYFHSRAEAKPPPTIHNCRTRMTLTGKTMGNHRTTYMNSIVVDETFVLSDSDEERDLEQNLLGHLLDPGEARVDVDSAKHVTEVTPMRSRSKTSSGSLENPNRNQLTFGNTSRYKNSCFDAFPLVRKSDSHVSVGQVSDCDSTFEQCDAADDDFVFPPYNHHNNNNQGVIHKNEKLNDVAYDEVYENDSCTDIDSPRSGADEAYDSGELQQVVIQEPQILPNPPPCGKSAVEIDEGTELKTFNVSNFNQHARKAHDEQYDEAEDVLSDDNDDIQNVAVNERLYGPNTTSTFNLDADDEEFAEEFSARHAQKTLGERTTFGGRGGFGTGGGSIEMPVKERDYYHSGSVVQNAYTRAVQRDVDSTVTFPLSSMRRSYGALSSRHEDYTVNRTSEGTCIQKDITHKEPPFGNPVNAGRLGRSVERLLGSSSSPPPSSMPRGEPIRSLEEGGGATNSSEDKSSDLNATNRKKKKKKKTNNKDEGGMQMNKMTDENGNPVEHPSHEGELRSLKPIEQHAPMTSWSPQHSQFVTFAGEDNPTRPDQDQAFKEKKERRKQRKQQEEAKMIKAENIQGYKGDQAINHILEYIDGTKSKKGKKKPTVVVQDNGLPDKQKPPSKKPANRKTQSKSMEDKCSENSSERGDDASSKVSDLGEDKIKDSDLADEGGRVNDSGSESSNSSDLIKDIAATAEAKSDQSSSSSSTKVESDDVSSVDLFTTPLVNDNYIFTDYDSVSSPREADFVTVSTKKKKVRSSAPPGNPHYQYKDYSYGGGGSHFYNSHRESSSSLGDSRSPGGFGPHPAQLPPPSRSEDRRFSGRPSRPYARSVTPPPTSLSSSLTHDGSHDSIHYNHNKARERAFSPTSSIPFEKKRSSQDEEDGDFPVISDQSNDFPRLPTSSPHEGRRNSTGNVPSELNPDADSDMESVKSLPLASSSCSAQADNTTSPRNSAASSTIISYARIAAGSRGGGGGGGGVVKTMSMSSSTSTASVNSVPSSTVSNGTHNSAGAPGGDVTKPDEGYVTTDHTADSGLSNNVSASSSKSDELSSLSGCDHPPTTATAVKTDSDQLLTRKSPDVEVESVDVGISPVATTTPLQQPEPVKSPEPDAKTAAASVRKVSSSSIHSESSCSSGSSKNHKADTNKVKTVINDKIDKVETKAASGVVTTGSEGVPSSCTKSVCGVSSKRTAKNKSSVVFLDKKIDAPPENMEISFGFDDEDDGRSPEKAASPQLSDNVQGMQFGGATMVYPTEGFVSGMPPVPPQNRLKGPLAGINGVIPSPEMMAFPPPHAIRFPVNMAHPPPAHLMMVPPPVPATSAHMMMPRPAMAVPATQFIPVAPVGVTRPPVMAPAPQRTAAPATPTESPVMFSGSGAQSRESTPQQQERKETTPPKEPEQPDVPPTDVSSEADFPPLSAAVGKRSPSLPAATSTPTATFESKGDYAGTSATSAGSMSPLQVTQTPPDVQFLPEAGANQGAEQDDDDDEEVRKFFPDRDQDPNFDCGNFNHGDAINYLQKEWDRVLTMEKKGVRVVHYND